jgi:hypothetical protein
MTEPVKFGLGACLEKPTVVPADERLVGPSFICPKETPRFLLSIAEKIATEL